MELLDFGRLMRLGQYDAGYVLPGLRVDNHEIDPLNSPVPQIFEGSQV